MEVFNKQIYLVRTPLVYMITSTSIYHNPVPVVQCCNPYWFQRGSGYGSGCKIFCQCGFGYGSGCRILMTKNWKKFTAVHFLTFFWSKIAIYLSLSLHEGRPSYRRSLHPLKSEHLAFQTWIFFSFVGHFGPPGSGSVFPMRIRVQIQPTKMNADSCGSGSRSRSTTLSGNYVNCWYDEQDGIDIGSSHVFYSASFWLAFASKKKVWAQKFFGIRNDLSSPITLTPYARPSKRSELSYFSLTLILQYRR